MGQLSETDKLALKTYMERYDLTADHFFKHNHYTIITRAGVDKIQAKAGISVEYEVLDDYCSNDHTTFLIRATGKLGDTTLQSFGEVTPDNNKNVYPIAMAEKRAMARVVLKLAGLYADNIFSEDEADDFKKSKASVTSGTSPKAVYKS
jgi:hypothetical protein